MRQLKQEGWMHHLGRHSVACFLTRGQLYISWERVRSLTSSSLSKAGNIYSLFSDSGIRDL